MSTTASPVMIELFRQIQAHEPRAVLSGIVGNAQHQAEEHSYHESWNDQRHDGGYSVHYDSDRLHIPGHWMGYAAAIDVSYGAHQHELMPFYTERFLHEAASAKRGDVLFGLMEVAGTVDNTTVTALDVAACHRTPIQTGPGWDLSHLQHNHLSIARSRVDDPRVLRLASVWRR